MRLIDADLIMDCLLNEGQNNGEKYGIKWGRKIIFTPYEVAKIVARTVPTVDAVPVVRCKDCKWFGQAGCAIQIVDDTDKPTETDYCSFGERKADTTDDTVPTGFMSEWAREIDEQLDGLTIKKDSSGE